MGDIETPTPPPPPHPSIYASVCPSRLVVALLLEIALLYFLETLQVCAPCHVFDIDGLLFEFFYEFLKVPLHLLVKWEVVSPNSR